jgi:ring-1,2-phenylacetyl-CoA epoxidase subunit PaaD
VVTVADMTSRLDDDRSLAVDRTVDLTVDLTRARALAAAVPDPEIPVLTIDDLGVLRDVTLEDDGTVVVTITPTYSGCPAMDAIRADVLTALQDGGFQARVDLVLSPAWTTDWMSADGRRKLTEYGIAPPPTEAERRRGPVALTLGIHCPQCGSLDTEQLSRFGSTACKALWRCRACAEPFDHFKSL